MEERTEARQTNGLNINRERVMRPSIGTLFSLERALARNMLAAAACMAIGCFGAGRVLAEEKTVAMGDNFFSPRNLTIQPGDSVNWVNEGNEPHTTTSSLGIPAYDEEESKVCQGTLSAGKRF